MPRLVRVLVPVFIVLGACSGQSEGPDIVLQNLANSLEAGHPEAIWDALPAGYQADISGIKTLFGENMDAELYDKGFQILGKLSSILESKKDFILSHPMIAAQAEGAVNDQQYEAVVKGLKFLFTSELSTLEGVRKLEIRSFIAKAAEESKDLMTAADVGGPQSIKLGDLSEWQFTLEDQKGDTAIVLLQKDQEEHREKFIKVEDKWVPVDMAADWDDKIAEAREKIAELPSTITAEQKQQAMMMMNMIVPALDQVEQASTQEEFNQAIGMLMGMAMGGAMGGGMGGPQTMPEE